jgi:hypothetical protein
MVRACSSLAVALLVPSVALGAPATSDDTSHVAANVVIDLAPAPDVPAWFATSFERTISHELAGFERLGTIAKQDVALGACGADRECRLRAYRSANVDIVLFGTVGDDAIAYELFQTWTPARLDTGTIDIGRRQSVVGLEHATRDAFHVVLKHGGLLDQKPYAVDRGPAAASTIEAGWTAHALGSLFAVLALLALPFALALIGGESRDTIFDPRVISELVTTWAWLVAAIGGLGWGAFLVFVVRTAFPPLDGLERVPQGELGRFLATWCFAALERLAVLAIVNAPLVVLVAWLGDSLAIEPQWVYLLLAPAVVWLARLWFLSWVDCIAARHDRRLVESDASANNPWSREVADYVMGYVRRTGWDLDPKLLASVIFLPGKRVDGVVAYGGGTTSVRIVIERELLVLALGPLLEDKGDDKPALWPDWTIARVAPNPSGRPISVTPSPHDFRGRKRRTIYPGTQRKPLGQAATLLGYATPAPGQLVPLISDSPQDLAIVRELLSEHYPWFAPDPAEEYDATDPTDKDLLFGALVHELGAVRRDETQLTTLRLAFGRRIAGITSRVRARLADSYAALNFARHHLIQYLYYRWTKNADALTARAKPAQLHEVSTRMFAEPIVDRRGVLATRVAAAVVIAALLVAGGFAVKRSIDYHPTYVERMQKGAVDGERQR